jgi:hypothetical protein
MVTVEDIEKVFRFASLFYHSPLRFHEVLWFRLKTLGNHYGTGGRARGGCGGWRGLRRARERGECRGKVVATTDVFLGSRTRFRKGFQSRGVAEDFIRGGGGDVEHSG